MFDLDAPAPQLSLPRAGGFDSSFAFVRDGYTFASRQFDRLGTDIFRTRLGLSPVTVIRGEDAARIFYEGDRFGRDRSMPTSVTHLLQDDGSVQSLSGTTHFHRKSMFVRMLANDAALDSLGRIVAEEWRRALGGWPRQVTLLEEVPQILTRAALRWTGIDPSGTDVPARAREFLSTINNAATLGPIDWTTRWQRRRTQSWAKELITNIRRGRTQVGEGSIVGTIALHRDENDVFPEAQVAAIELINVLRPVVAVSRFVVFEALALYRHPHVFVAVSTASAISPEVENFVNEVRRFYPFFPAIGGRVRREFEWREHDFRLGDWVLLDLYGTNRDPRIWDDPNRFVPDRFIEWSGDQNTLIPQGGGAMLDGHRCPGERATVAVMAAAVPLLVETFQQFSVADQDLRVSLRRFPSSPESGFVLTRRSP